MRERMRENKRENERESERERKEEEEEIERTQKVDISKLDFQVVGEACKAILYSVLLNKKNNL